MSYLSDIEDACIAKILSAKRAGDPTRSIVNKCDTYRGEKDEVFAAIIREVAPAVWIFFDQAKNAAREFEQAMATGQPFSMGTTQDRETLLWSFLIGTQSLRAPRELSHGGPNVVGGYELLEMLTGAPPAMPNPPAASPAQLRGWQPVPYAEPFIYVDKKLVAFGTTAAVFELQLRTRVQL